MLKSCATLTVREKYRSEHMREPRTSPSKRAVEASIGTDLRSYFRSVSERTAAGEQLTQEDLADELGVSKTTVNKWLSDYGFEAITVYIERGRKDE